MEFSNVGKLCPLCKKGVITYVKRKDWEFLWSTVIEYTSCSNPECDAYMRT